VHVLATAYDDADNYAPEIAGPKYPPEAYTPERLAEMQGINRSHPQSWVQEYGAGRVFSITLGHGPEALATEGVQTFILRGAEWAATGEVTIPPLERAADFPVPGAE
jgi:hypothetical protein